MTSAKDIVFAVPTPPPSVTLDSNVSSDERNAVFRRLRAFKQSMPETTNKHDIVDVLISACIDEGFDTGPRITGAVRTLGFDRQHVGMRLRAGIGNRWTREESGRYRALL